MRLVTFEQGGPRVGFVDGDMVVDLSASDLPRDIVSGSREPDAVAALIRFVHSPAALAVWTRKGFEAP